MITVSLSLALCTVMFRRFMDSFTGRIPAVIQSSSSPNTTALFMFSGALYYLYTHLKKGTLVRVGQGRTKYSGCNPSRTTIHRRHKNNSWFLRNARACRKKCTDAVYKIAKQSYESLHNLNPCLLLPTKSFHISFSKVNLRHSTPERQSPDKSENSCNVIFSNEDFDKDSNHIITLTESDVKTVRFKDDNTRKIIDKRPRKSILKRLCEERPKLDVDDTRPSRLSNNHKNKKKLMKIKRMTRSGRVYSRFE